MGGSSGLCAALFLATLCSGAATDDCTPARCSAHGPIIRSPFRKRDQPPHCGYVVFELSCRGDETVVDLPFSGQFPLTSVSYDKQRLHLDPRSCPPATFFNLNLSDTPFELYNSTDRWGYMLLNCSSEFPTTPPSVTDNSATSCLDSSGRHVFAVSTGYLSNLNETCVSMRTEAVPLAFVDSLCPNGSYNPSLGWGTPYCKRGFRNWNSQEIACYPSPTKSGRWTAGKIIGVSVGAFCFILALATITRLSLSWKWNRDKALENQMKIEKFLEDYKSLNPMRYSYSDIKKITDQFKTKLGEGGYGSVFKGVLPSGIQVAVKVLKRTIGNDGEDFVNEVQTIGRIHHVNVVRLLGFCADANKRALIYEFMPNESLAKFIFPKDHSGPSLGWAKLHEIAIGIARGIEYLHQGCEQRILHFDIKPHNILLDNNLNPKISDFGLAKLCSKEQSIVSMSFARGTVGYIAPEVASRDVGNVSYKSDIYSFGMLLLEMVGGRKNVDASAENTSQIYFPEWIYRHMHQGFELGLNITEEEDAKIARILATTALWCIQWYPVNRPSMESVVQMLEGSMESSGTPPNPFVFTVATDSGSDLKAHQVNLTVISESETEETIDIAVPR